MIVINKSKTRMRLHIVLCVCVFVYIESWTVHKYILHFKKMHQHNFFSPLLLKARIHVIRTDFKTLG